MELPLQASCLALHWTFAAPVQSVTAQSPMQSGFVNCNGHPLIKNLCSGLIGLPHASYVTKASSISRDICSNFRVPSSVLKSVRPPLQTALIKRRFSECEIKKKYQNRKKAYPFSGVKVQLSATRRFSPSNCFENDMSDL